MAARSGLAAILRDGRMQACDLLRMRRLFVMVGFMEIAGLASDCVDDQIGEPLGRIERALGARGGRHCEKLFGRIGKRPPGVLDGW